MSDKRTPKQLSEALDGWLTPEQAALRLKELLSGDLLSDLEERKLLLLDARIFLSQLQDDVNMGDAKARTEYLKALRFVAERLDKSELSVDLISTKLSTAYAQVMASAIQLAFERAAFELEKRYQIPQGEAREVLMIELPVAVAEIEKNTE